MKIVGARTIPLTIACQHGELDSVKRLIETWGGDLRTPASYYSIPADYNLEPARNISVTPLFVAAFHGHSPIVRYLLEKMSYCIRQNTTA